MPNFLQLSFDQFPCSIPACDSWGYGPCQTYPAHKLAKLSVITTELGIVGLRLVCGLDGLNWYHQGYFILMMVFNSNNWEDLGCFGTDQEDEHPTINVQVTLINCQDCPLSSHYLPSSSCKCQTDFDTILSKSWRTIGRYLGSFGVLI